ncbi:MAG: hypothetical protein JNM39_11455 [Bdellovibrionaceae bacterium]|nr:hypothetical protein [Pseudobdellovibrionaceae bacterium]
MTTGQAAFGGILFLLVTFFSGSAYSSAPLECRRLLSQKEPIYLDALYKILTKDEIPKYLERIDRLARRLIDANLYAGSPLLGGLGFRYGLTRETVYNWGEFQRLEFKKIEPRFHGSKGYEVFSAFVVVYSERDKQPLRQKVAIEFRTNGHFAFLSNTFLFRTELLREYTQRTFHYSAVFFENDSIRIVDQGEAIISSLPVALNLSRSMSSAEREEWLSGIISRSPRFGEKIHFAPQYMYYNQMPYLIPVTRRFLLDAYRRGEIEINTYDNAPEPTDPQIEAWGQNVGLMWMGELKLEFEIVFTGKAGLTLLKPLMRDALRQQTLDLRIEHERSDRSEMLERKRQWKETVSTKEACRESKCLSAEESWNRSPYRRINGSKDPSRSYDIIPDDWDYQSP